MFHYDSAATAKMATMPIDAPPSVTPNDFRPPAKDVILANATDPDTATDAKYDYDFIVIGGGSGGLAAAKKARSFSKPDAEIKVALCDFVTPSPHGTTWGLGGTCVNVGCIPKKLMHTAAVHGENAAHAMPHFGWDKPATAAKCDWGKLVESVNQHIAGLNYGYRTQLKKKDAKVDYINAFARFVDAHTIETTDAKKQTKTLTARRFLIAVGGRPTDLDIPGGEHAISSDDIFKLDREPGKTLVIGASYVALECAGFLNGIGRDATVMMRSIPLRGFDQQMAGKIVDYMEKTGTKFLKQFVPTKVEKGEDGRFTVHWKSSQKGDETTGSDVFDTVFVAVGRKPATAALGLDKAGVKCNDKGQVITDTYDRTSTPNIYAIGDIIEGGLELTPVAIQAGQLLAERLYNRGTKVMSLKLVPTTVFTPIEYGCCGWSEEDAKEKNKGFIEVYHSEFTPLEWAIPDREGSVAHGKNQCYLKLICNPFDNERILGFHYLGPNAGEITQAVAVAMRCNATKADFDDTVGIHPTVAEEMTTLTVTKRSGQDAGKTGC